MFQIGFAEERRVVLEGRLDAAHADQAQAFLDGVTEDCVLDLSRLEYISSAGLGVLLRTHKRLTLAGHGLKLVKVNRHINDIFTYSGFDRLFTIEPAEGAG